MSGVSGRVVVSGLPRGEKVSCDAAQVTCTVSAPEGETLRLAANMPAGQTPGRFSNGTGPAASCSLSTCNLSLTADAEVTATFGPDATIVTLTTALSGDGAGAVTVDNLTCQNYDPAQASTCATAYVQGSQVSLYPNAAAGSRMSTFGASTFTIASDTTFPVVFHALTSMTVSPASASQPALVNQEFIAYGTYSNGVTERLPFSNSSLGTWTTKAPMATARSSFAAASASGKLYAIGGRVPTGVSTSAAAATVEAYDPASNTWTAVASMQSPRAAFAAASAGGLVYAIGGNDGTTSLSAVERYDPAGNTWTAVAPLASTRERLAAGVIGGIIYAVGGYAGGAAVGTLEAYDPATNTWSTKAPMPTPRSALGAAAVAGKLYAVGGSDALGNPVATVEAYDPGTNTWTSRNPLQEASTMLTVVAVEDTMYAATSVEVQSSLPAMYAYDPTWENSAGLSSWRKKSSVTSPRGDAAAAALGTRVYVIGGVFASGIVPTVQAFTEDARFSSSNTRIATIDVWGFATGFAAGTASITVSAGDIVCSGCATMTITSTVPRVTTGAATNITEHSATLSGIVNPNGVETSAHFEYLSIVGTVVETTSIAPVSVGSGVTDVPLTVTLTGLPCNTQYAFSIVGANSTVTLHGQRAGFTTLFSTAACPRARRGDFDGDGKADLAVVRKVGGGLRDWFVQGAATNQFGLAGDIPVAADYDGTGRIQPTVFRPAGWGVPSGVSAWYFSSRYSDPVSGSSGSGVVYFGLPGDIPVPADYDGNHTDDIATFRPTEATWYVRNQFTRAWGQPGDIPMPADYDADGKADLAVFRPSTGVWSIAYSSTGFTTSDAYQWGLPGDIPVTGDFDGDGRADLAVFRPGSGTWYIAMSSTAYVTRRMIQYGLPGDVPMARDLDGDGLDEIVVFRPESGMWFWYALSTDTAGSQQWGLFGDEPVGARPRSTPRGIMDVDGDGRSELLVYRPANGIWYTLHPFTGAVDTFAWGCDGTIPVAVNSISDMTILLFRPADGWWPVSGSCTPWLGFQWGVSGDVPVPADYDGDRGNDVAVFRPTTGEWFIAGPYRSLKLYAHWGVPGDIPMPADYDGDGRADFAVWRPSTGEWWVRFSSGAFGGSLVRQWGLSTDIPIAADFDGDGRADFAVWRPSTGEWWVMNPFTGVGQLRAQWGLNGDRPIVKDLDGDGRADFVVWRPATGEWWIRYSSTGAVVRIQWGLNGDVPF